MSDRKTNYNDIQTLHFTKELLLYKLIRYCVLLPRLTALYKKKTLFYDGNIYF